MAVEITDALLIVAQHIQDIEKERSFLESILKKDENIGGLSRDEYMTLIGQRVDTLNRRLVNIIESPNGKLLESLGEEGSEVIAGELDRRMPKRVEHVVPRTGSSRVVGIRNAKELTVHEGGGKKHRSRKQRKTKRRARR